MSPIYLYARETARLLDARRQQLEASPGDRNVYRKVVRLAEGTENETPVHASLLFYNAKALHNLGLLDAARDTFTDALP